MKRNRGAAGIDKVSIAMFEKNLQPNLDSLRRELKAGTFQPLPARRVYIPKAPGKVRPLGIYLQSGIELLKRYSDSC